MCLLQISRCGQHSSDICETQEIRTPGVSGHNWQTQMHNWRTRLQKLWTQLEKNAKMGGTIAQLADTITKIAKMVVTIAQLADTMQKLWTQLHKGG